MSEFTIYRVVHNEGWIITTEKDDHVLYRFLLNKFGDLHYTVRVDRFDIIWNMFDHVRYEISQYLEFSEIAKFVE